MQHLAGVRVSLAVIVAISIGLIGGDLAVAQVCNPIYTVTSKLPKSLLPTASAYAGKHTELRDQAAAYRAEQ